MLLTRSSLAISALLAAVSLLGASCGEAAGTSTSGGGAGGAGEAASTTTSAVGPGPVTGAGVTSGATTGAGGANPDDPYGCLLGPPPSRPAAIPEGYRPWACWSQKPQCMLWIPEDPETMVEPITWEPCAEGSPGGDGCRQMARPWPFQYYGAIGVTYPAVPELDTTGAEPLLRLARASVLDATSGYLEYLVGEVDGPVRYSMRRPWVEGTECGFQDYDLAEGVWAVAPIGDDTVPRGESPHDGLIAIDVNARSISLPYRDDQPQKASWTSGAGWFVRHTGPKTILHDRGFTQEVVLQDTSTDPLGASSTAVRQVVGDTVLWEVGTSSHVGIRAYDPERGPHDLVRYPDDLTRGAGTPGTDGVDLVWMEGTGRQPGDTTYPERSMMTSPFTTDPAALEPRRLRKDLAKEFGTAGSAFKVGCGRAVKAEGASSLDVQIVRLSDGRGWNLVNTPEVWKASSVVGLTCDEVFIVVQFWEGGVIQGSTIQRIRFDALGEGLPPD